MRRILSISMFILVAVSALFPLCAQAGDYNSTYERVMETGTIRCAYFVVPPEFNKNPNTGEFSGIGYEVTEHLGEILGLEIEWVEEISFSNQAQGLKSGRYDAVCSSVWNKGKLGRVADFTRPFMYTAVGTYVRADDMRFDKDLSAINKPDIKIVALEGAGAIPIAKSRFPKAKILSMPGTTSIAQQLRNVATGKADVAFTYPANFKDYNDNNPGELKAVHKEKPVRVFGNTIMVPKGADKFRNMLNTALHQAIVSGNVNHIIDKYEEYDGSYYRVKMPFKLPDRD